MPDASTQSASTSMYCCSIYGGNRSLTPRNHHYPSQRILRNTSELLRASNRSSSAARALRCLRWREREKIFTKKKVNTSQDRTEPTTNAPLYLCGALPASSIRPSHTWPRSRPTYTYLFYLQTSSTMRPCWLSLSDRVLVPATSPRRGI